MKERLVAASLLGLLAGVVLGAQDGPSPKQLAQERAQAEREVPRLVEVLEVEPGMTVADVGAGFGAMTLVLARWLQPAGRVFATDIAALQLAIIRDRVAQEELTKVTVLEGADASTNLPAGCCDAIFMRDVYHHLTQVEAFNASLRAALKPGGRLAVIDFVPRPGSPLFPGVNPNRGGHGIFPPLVASEVSTAGFTHVRTIDPWPNTSGRLFLVLFRK
jgi:predicted methyltransferase